MKRALVEHGERQPKRRKIQQSIRSMFLRSGPVFVEAPGIQQVCGYCNRRFMAPQGMIIHLRMHERAGDFPIANENQRSRASDIRSPSPSPSVERSHDPVERVPEIEVPIPAPATVSRKMTRNFNIAEKLMIIDKFKELENVSATCRWVKNEFRRTTFARKTLREMIAREDAYRKSFGTRSKKKTVRVRAGQFHRMDKKLAEWVRETRKLGIPVESYMLPIEGLRIMKELYPNQFDEDGLCTFKFSSGWRTN